MSPISNNRNPKFALQYLVFGLVVLLIFGLTYSLQSARSSSNSTGKIVNPLAMYFLQQPMVVLVAGCDQEYTRARNGYMVKVKNSFHGRTDTIILAKFDPVKKTISALNIPRDTKIYINGHRPDKINSINTMGGPEQLKKVLEGLLDIKIDHYVLVNTSGVEQIIDQAGGIEVDIPKRMVYHDQTDGLNINFQPGKRLLSGKEAVGFLRFRHDNLGDIGRIQRQQSFMRAIKAKLADPSLLTRLPQLATIGMESLKTDLTVPDMLKLANFVRVTPTESQIFATLPGDFSMPEVETKVVYEEVPVADSGIPSAEGEEPAVEPETVLVKKVVTVAAPFVSYWLPNEAEIKEVVDRLFRGDDGSASQYEPSRIKIAIENSTQNKAFTSKLSKILHKRGYNIIDISSSFQKQQPSGVYAQRANLKEAQFVSRDLGLPSTVKVMAGNIASPLADVAIMIGPELEAYLTNSSSTNL